MTLSAATRWSRAVALLLTIATTFVLGAVVMIGLLFVTTDWSALGCFDGNEAGCATGEDGAAGLGAIRASSWIAGVTAVVALAIALWTAWHLQNARQLVVVTALDAGVVALALLLWFRL